MDYDIILKEFYDHVSEEEKTLYENLAKKAIELGYFPKREKTKNVTISFSNRKTKKTLLKYSVNSKRIYGWRLKFYANKEYSKIFDQSIKEEIERFNFKYVGCYGCGKCKKEKLGYNIKYEDGTKYFRCGGELIPVKIISDDVVKEAVKMMDIQHLGFINELELKNK
jgi:hypothetical protein